MSESEPQGNPEYVEMTPITRYYSDVANLINSESYVTMSLHSLLESFPVDREKVLDEMRSSLFMPFDWEIAHDPVIAKEKLAMLPLSVIQSELEKANCDVDEIKSWYDNAVGGIRAVTLEVHSNHCLDRKAPNHLMCDFSTDCPLLFTERFLLREAEDPDFSKPMYRTAPDRQFTLTKNNIGIAIKQQFISSEIGDSILELYAFKFNQFMVCRTSNPSDNII
ncbi:MAG: hypothetical protein JWM07_4 [Candidatus Saccharibacteria bacterium]|jgi:hypothetical protein|nr:hypothetical protein [Candidatus Saccharibacteria bacterium]